ncbi:MAG: 16S rRNA (guanine(527)-N(7))-methyltransferase RsmG [Rhizobiaceae bacterium]|nr:16S rRNA (guanine(527)-N(7))-methyltransferase RsmG [Rhizobiaceae bacterium]MCV0404660.1 16S rRNA (guanine(527)-N(7))-methyltransferase RsmG [Rhizobiaceae bacterium]
MNDDRYEALRKVAGEVSRETFSALRDFEAMFLQWSKRINLAASSTLPDIWHRHVLDSAQLLPLIGRPRHLVDFGSGGGFPAMVLAILMRDDGTRVSMVESNGKKASFLRLAASRFASGGAHVLCERADEVVAATPAPEVVTARAFAPLSAILALAKPWTDRGTILHLHKGRDYHAEIAEAGDLSLYDLVERPSAVDSDSVILTLRRAA